jgi:type IV secretion system protein VirB10
MKSKFTKKPDPELEQEGDDVEVDAGGPSIALASKSKFAIIAASSLLITLVLYFFLIKKEDKKVERLEKVDVPNVAKFTPGEKGASPFALPEIEVKQEEPVNNVMEKPLAPEIPELPSLPEDSVLPDQIILPEKEEPVVVKEDNNIPKTTEDKNIPQQQNQNNQVPQQQQNNQQPAAQEMPEEVNKDLDPRYAPIIVFSGVAQGTPSRGVGYENNIVMLNENPIDKLAASQTGVTATFIKDRTHTVAQGKLLTAVLETAINTEVPGSVRGIISRDVYAESGNEVLIPRGSRLFGSYSSNISQGQGRVEISWTRLIRPDGVDLSISFTASDRFGRAGISGEVDNKYGSIITNSILTSVLAVGGVAAAQKILGDSDGSTTTTNASQGTTTTTGSATNQAIYDVSKTITDTISQVIGSTLDVNPIIRVPQGTKITVIVNSDITIPSMK